jgi:hypothetical protein
VSDRKQCNKCRQWKLFSAFSPVRGVLCRGCNRLLGEAKDSAGILARAIYYLSVPQDVGRIVSAEHVG